MNDAQMAGIVRQITKGVNDKVVATFLDYLKQLQSVQRRLLLEQQKGQPKVDPDSKDMINYKIKGNVVRIGTVEVGLATLKKIVAEMERILGISK